jgi:hypothetical protein
VLDMIDFEQMQQREIRTVSVYDVIENLHIEPVAPTALAVLEAFDLRLIQNAGRLQLRPERGRGVGIVERLCVDARDCPVERFRTAAARPHHSSGLQPGPLCEIIDRRHAHDLLLVEERVPNQRHQLARCPIEEAVSHDPVLCRGNSGDQGGVDWPGDRGQDCAHLLGPSAFRGEPANGWHLSLRIVEIEMRQPIHTQENDDAFGSGIDRAAWNDQQEEGRDKRGEKIRGEHQFGGSY